MEYQQLFSKSSLLMHDDLKKEPPSDFKPSADPESGSLKVEDKANSSVNLSSEDDQKNDDIEPKKETDDPPSPSSQPPSSHPPKTGGRREEGGRREDGGSGRREEGGGKRPYNKKTSEKIKRWTKEESQLYENFIEMYADIFNDPSSKRVTKIFIFMSKYIGTKTPSQCRSHHQKFFKKIQNLKVPTNNVINNGNGAAHIRKEGLEELNKFQNSEKKKRGKYSKKISHMNINNGGGEELKQQNGIFDFPLEQFYLNLYLYKHILFYYIHVYYINILYIYRHMTPNRNLDTYYIYYLCYLYKIRLISSFF